MLSERYQLGSVIGSGGMSEVYAAQDTSLGRDVAVKMLRPEMARDVNFRERFRREAQNSARLNHPNIVAVYDTGETERDGINVPYIVMERVHGRTLRDLVRENGPLSFDEAAEILGPVCSALQASHEAGIIHRDVKPANIMLTNTGQVKVMDFGIARALDDSTAAMTQTSAVIGTAQYLSPEQARGKAADARSDVYALGCVLYETVTGRTPFEGETPFAVAYQHVQEDPVPPSSYLDNLSPNQQVNIDAVVLTAMAKHPADRYQSAWEMGEDLGRLARGSVTRAARLHVPGTGGAPHQEVANPTRTIPAPQQQAAPAPVAPMPATTHAAAPAESSALKWLAVLLSVILVAAIGFFAWDFLSNSDGPSNRQGSSTEQSGNLVTIPEVENRTFAEVDEELSQLGLIVRQEKEASPDIKRGKVIKIDPAAGSELQTNSTVTVTVSTGKKETKVPDLQGLKLEDAVKLLEKQGLKLDEDIEEKYDRDVPEGEIMSQNPRRDSKVAEGEKVRVTVSKGSDAVRVSHVQGMSLQEAQATLEAQGLNVQFNVVDSTKPDNQVTSVSNQGEEVSPGSTITLEVSNGMLIQVPELVRMSETQARSVLANLGWTGSFNIGEIVDTPSPPDNDKIAWASVSGGEIIRKDQDIDIRKWSLISLGDALSNLTG